MQYSEAAQYGLVTPRGVRRDDILEGNFIDINHKRVCGLLTSPP